MGIASLKNYDDFMPPTQNEFQIFLICIAKRRRKKVDKILNQLSGLNDESLFKKK